MAKLPAMQFYPGDWRKDIGVQSLTFHDRGIWFEMLMLMHESDIRGMLVLNGRPMPVEALARLLGLDIQVVNQTLSNLITTGVASIEPNSGAIMCRRMVRDENIRKVRTEAGKKGGNPALLNQNTNQTPTTGDKQIPTPSSSSSTTEIKDPSIASRFVLEKCGLSKTRAFLEAVGDQAKMALDAGGDLVEWAEGAVKAYLDYQDARNHLEYPSGAEKFFSTGLYRHRENWKYKEGHAPKNGTRKYYEGGSD